jgi:hypothetical protein
MSAPAHCTTRGGVPVMWPLFTAMSAPAHCTTCGGVIPWSCTELPFVWGRRVAVDPCVLGWQGVFLGATGGRGREGQLVSLEGQLVMAPIPVPLPPVVAKVSGGGVVEGADEACALRVGCGGVQQGCMGGGPPGGQRVCMGTTTASPPPTTQTPHAAVNVTAS